jgi:hypothetical protein
LKPILIRAHYNLQAIFNIYDDHVSSARCPLKERTSLSLWIAQEIINNFIGRSNASTEPFPNAASAYYSYNGQANYDPIIKGGNYYEFRYVDPTLSMYLTPFDEPLRYGDVAFFVLDTRLYRSGEVTREGEKKTMLGEPQLTALYKWLDRVCFLSKMLRLFAPLIFWSLGQHHRDIQIYSLVRSLHLSLEARRAGRFVGGVRR